MKREKGFTLIELMVVVVILAVVGGIAIPKLMQHPKKGREESCFADIATLTTILDLFLMELNEYPTTGEGLAYLETCTEPGWTPIPWRKRDLDADDVPDTPWSKEGSFDEYQYESATPTRFSLWVGGSYANARTAVYKPNEGMRFRYPP